jgi:hypothetical protein
MIMPLNKGKHIIAELDGVRCTVVESKTSLKRVEFLKGILENNGYEVKVQQDAPEADGAPQTFTIGVTDMVFNPVIAVYEKKLRKKDGKMVTPAFWNQQAEELNIPYWLVGRG